MRYLSAATAALTLVLGTVAPASAAEVATGPGGFLAGFVPPAVVIAEGEGITYTNADIAPHNFVADGAFLPKKAERRAEWCTSYDRGRCPLFWSPTIATGESTEVSGLERLSAGDQFPFLCTLHPNMKGTLIVR